jgi:hypothetical protein
MVTKAVLVDFHARTGHGDEVERLVSAGVGGWDAGVVASFAVRFGPQHFGVFSAFDDDDARTAHLVATPARDPEGHCEEPPRVRLLEVVASKLPSGPVGDVRKGVLLTLTAKDGRAGDVEHLLAEGREIVDDELGTLAWFALRFDDGRYGIFDVFPDNRARMGHLSGRIPRRLAVRAPKLLGGLPGLTLLDVVDYSLTGSSSMR